MPTITSQLIVELLDRVTGPARQVSNSLRGITRTVKEVSTGPISMGDRLNAAIARNNQALADARMGIADAVAGYYVLKAAIGAPVAEAMRFESAMADVKKVVDFQTPEAFLAFQTQLMALSRDIPLSVTGLGEIAAAAGQAGIAGADLVRFTEAAAKIGVAFDISAADAGDAMAKMMTGLGLSIDEAVSLSDAMNHLSNAQASSAPEILDVVRRVGAQGKMFGFTAEQTAAFGSAMIASGAQSDVAATSFNNMGKALTKGAAATKGQQEAYAALGLRARTVAKRMQKDATGTTLEVLERISRLPKEQQAAVASQLFGDEARALGPLLTNLDLLRASLGLVADEASYTGSSFKEFEARNKTFGSAMQRFNNLITNLKINIGNALIPVLGDLIERITPFMDQIVTLAGKYPNLTAGIVASTAALIGFRVAIAGLRFLGLMGKGGMLATMAAGLRTLTVALAGLRAVAVTGPLGALAGGFIRLRAAIAGLAMLGSVGGFSAVFQTLGSGLLSLLNPLRLVTAAAVALRGAIMLTGVGAILVGIAIAGKFIYDNWSGIKEMFIAFGKAFSEALGPVKPLLDPVVSGVSSIFDWLSRINLEISPARWAEWGAAAGKAVGEVVRWFAELPGRIMAAIGSIDIASMIRWPTPPAWISWLMSGGGSGPVAKSPNRSEVITGARARGGPVSRGGSYWVGERGPELITAGRSGYVNKAGSVGGAGGVTVSPVFNMTFNGRTEPDDVVQQIRQVLRNEVRETFRGVFADTSMRFA